MSGISTRLDRVLIIPIIKNNVKFGVEICVYNPCHKTMGLPRVEWQPEAKRRGLYRPSNFAKHIRILQNYWKVRSTTGLPAGLYFCFYGIKRASKIHIRRGNSGIY